MLYPNFYRLHTRTLLPFLVVLMLHILAIRLLLNPEKPQAKTQEPKVLLASLVASSTPQVNANKPPQKTIKKQALFKPERQPKPEIELKAKPISQALSPSTLPAPKPVPETVIKTEQKKTSDPVETINTNTEKEPQELKHIPDNTINTDDDTKAAEHTVVTAIQVDARSTQNHPPVYPKLSKRLKEEGTVLLSLLISAQGRIEEISIHESSGYSRLDKAALSAATKWRYEPATVNGIAIAQNYLMPIEFKLNTTKR